MTRKSDSLPISEPRSSLNPFKSKDLPPSPPEHSQEKKRFSFPFTKTHTHDHTHNTSNAAPIRPGAGALNRSNSVNTRYMDMLLHFQDIPRKYNIMASFFTWVLLAGFVIFPGTFTTIRSGKFDEDAANRGQVAERILEGVKNIPLLAIAVTACGVGAIGMVFLWWRWRHNYVFLVNRIFLPGSLNSLAGLISTLVNVYTQQNKVWSTTAKVTAIVTGASMLVCAGLLLLYNLWYLEKVRKDHFSQFGTTEGPEEADSKVGAMGKI